VSYRIEIVPSAEQEIRALPAYVRAQARQLVPTLARNPRPSRSQELRGRPGIYRIWLAGRWRVVYQVDDSQQVVTILRVRLKEDIDYNFLGSAEYTAHIHTLL
jgi:mRNA-degrading endonuclease RelE of RelBE toxin-antitoxin system